MKLKKAFLNLKRTLFPEDYLGKLQGRGLTVGKNFNMQHGVILDDSHCWHISIGDNVTLAPNVHILAHDASTKAFLGYTKIGKVTIGNEVFIGASAIVLPGISIGDKVIIGAGSLVNKSIPSGCVAVGNPIQIVGTIEEFIKKKKEEMKVYPLFDESYTLRKGVTLKKCEEMNEKMIKEFGYII